MDNLRVACLASGGGSTVAAILDAIRSGHLPGVTVPLIITNKANAGVIEKAKARGYGLDCITLIDRKAFDSEEAFGESILRECRQRSIDFIGQYGWLPRTPRNVIEAYRGRLVNQHPGLVSGMRSENERRLDFGGKGMYGRRVVAASHYFHRKWPQFFPCTYATAHHVTEGIDEGRVIRAWAVQMSLTESVDQLHKRMLPVEHMVQIATLGDFASEGCFTEVEQPSSIEPLLVDDLENAKMQAIRDYPNG